MLKRFFYIGYSRNGKFKCGIKKNITPHGLRSFLKTKGILVKNIYPLPACGKLQERKNIKFFFTQGKLFIKNGYNFSEIFELFEENDELKIYTNNMKKEINKGESLYNALKKSGMLLTDAELMVIKVGEESGNLYETFNIIEKKLTHKEQLKKEIKKIMFYPLIVLTLLIFLIFFMSCYILPDFIDMIENNSNTLPIMTKTLLFFSHNFTIILILLITIITFTTKTLRKTKYKKKVFNFLIKFNAFKKFAHRIFALNLVSTLKNLIVSGITITEALKIIKSEIKYEYFREKITTIENILQSGKTISAAFKKIQILQTIDLEILRFGERAGDLEIPFTTIEERLRLELKETFYILTKLLEPLSILVVGIITGFVFLGVYLPIFQIMDNF